MPLLFLLLCLFVKPAFLQESQQAKLILQIGAPVMPAGQTVKMFCMVSFVVNKYTWYHLNQTTCTAMNINSNFLTLIVTTKDSGEYKCSGYYNGTRYDSNAVNLTVVGEQTQPTPRQRQIASWTYARKPYSCRDTKRCQGLQLKLPVGKSIRRQKHRRQGELSSSARLNYFDLFFTGAEPSTVMSVFIVTAPPPPPG
ncbi:unnamed protein product [Oncorhynchus mykiss]|uniref:Ig-like domain-containing protein n=1 Tax=Oncorhynchus mykiss TaxID=8022 RepID=A0A060WXF0_ONCMY|nr:unnamed protein product [Oncorhynchus mykiss]